MYKYYFKNPLSVWLKWLIKKIIVEFTWRKKQLKIGYLSTCGNCQFGHSNTIYDYVTLYDVALDDFTYISAHTTMFRTRIGKFCSIGPHVIAGIGRHPVKQYVSTHPIFYSTFKQAQTTFADKDCFEEFAGITIGNDVWIGAKVFIGDGVKIGDGAIVAAGSVVTKDIPAYAIFGGVPAKFIRYRFTEEQISFLKSVKWWERDIDWLKINFKLFHNIDEFTKKGNDSGVLH
jgi:acetyltransferase-like isoleucine patch superfamily enzyme